MKTRHSESVEGCGSPVETSAYKVCRSTDRAGRREAGLLWRPLHTKYAEAPTEPAGETKSFCPCHRCRGLSIVRDDFFFLKSHRLAHAVAPPLPKKSLTFRGPHKFAAQPCGFEPFFFCCLRLAHGPFCRILIPKTGADFPSGGIRLQRFRLSQYRKNGPIFFYILCVVNVALAMIYIIAVMSISGSNQVSTLVSQIIIQVVIIISNVKYFKNRKNLFIK